MVRSSKLVRSSKTIQRRLAPGVNEEMQVRVLHGPALR